MEKTILDDLADMQISSIKDFLQILPEKTHGIIISNLNKINSISKHEDKYNYYIFTDGSCIKNGKNDARGKFSFAVFDENKELVTKYSKEGKSNITNQVMELQAIYYAFKYVLQNIKPEESVCLFSDSDYSLKCITTWYKSWINNGWKTKTNGDVKHKDIISDIIKTKDKINDRKIILETCHVNSHTSEPNDRKSFEYFIHQGNKYADKLAKIEE